MVRIVTDSAANLPTHLAESYNIEVVPLRVQMGTESYREGVDLTQQEFFDRLPNTDPLPTTSQPSPSDFEAVYAPILEAGDEIVSIHISSKLSGTYNSAHNASLLFEDAAVSVVDSQSVSAGVALLVEVAARMAREGRSREEIVQQVEALVPQVLLVLTLDTLEYLKKGGRIGGAQAFIGGLLRIKPVIMIKDGVLHPGERARSRRKALESLVEMEVERFGKQPVWVGIADAVSPDIGQLETMAREQLNVENLMRCEIGPVVATHTGPHTAGIAVMPAPS